MRTRTVFLLLAVVMIGCGGEPQIAADGPATPAGPPSPGATDNCGAVETIPIQGEGHLVGDQEPPVPYNSTPPTSGWHASGDIEFDVTGEDDPLTEPEQVTVLELGGVVVSYNGLDPATRDELATLVGTDYRGLAAMTPYAALGDGEVALAAWGRLQRCETADVAAVRSFIETFATVKPGDA